MGASMDAKRRPVSHPRLSNRTCPFQASGFPGRLTDARLSAPCRRSTSKLANTSDRRKPVILKRVIRTVIFDLGKVLIPFDFARGYRAMEPLCGYSAADIPRRIGATDLVPRFETGLVEPRDFVAQLSRMLDLNIGYEKFCEVWSCIFLPDTLVPESLLEGLRARYRLVLLSNTNAIHFEMVRERYPMLRHFHEFVLSYEVRAMKPSPLIYREAIARAACRPEECFFTDDMPQYVEAARREGIDAVRFESREQLERELAARGIQWM